MLTSGEKRIKKTLSAKAGPVIVMLFLAAALIMPPLQVFADTQTYTKIITTAEAEDSSENNGTGTSEDTSESGVTGSSDGISEERETPENSGTSQNDGTSEESGTEVNDKSAANNDDQGPSGIDLSEARSYAAGFSPSAIQRFDISYDDETGYEILTVRTDNLPSSPEGDNIYYNLEAALLKAKTDGMTRPCKVIVPPGNYITKTVDSTEGTAFERETNGILHIHSNTWLYAKGAVIKRIGDGGMLKCGYQSEQETSAFIYRNIKVEGGTWDANGKNATRNCCTFRFGHATNVTVKDLQILNNRGSHHLELGATNGVTVTGCTFKGHHNYLTSGQEAIQIDAAISQQALPDYYSNGAVSKNINISGNRFEKVFAGVGSHNYIKGKPYTGITIKGNTFYDISRYAVYTERYEGADISGNSISSRSRGMIFYYGTSNCRISGNSIDLWSSKKSNKCSYGLNIRYNCSGNTISGNTVKNVNNEGILLYGGNTKNKIYGNSVSGSNKSGICISGGKSNIVEKNVIKSNKSYGLYIKSKASDTKVQKNKISYNKNCGIYVSGKSKVSKLSGNNLTMNKKSEIYIVKKSKAPAGSFSRITIKKAEKKVITGKCQKSRTIKAAKGTKVIGKAKAKKNKTFKIKIKSKKKGTEIKLWTADKKGNKAIRYVKIK